MTPPLSRPAPHSSKLDLLRILLCLCVLLCHFYPGYHALAGNVAVLGFFVLSGYLLQASFYRMGQFDVERFFAGKAKRLLPVYACSIALSLVIPVCAALEGRGVFILPAEADIFSIFKYIWVYNVSAWYMGCLITFMLLAPALWCLHRLRWGIAGAFACALAFAAFLYWRHDGTSAVLMGMEGKMCPYPQVRLWQFLAGMLICRWAKASTGKLPPCLRGCFSSAVFLLLAALSLWVTMQFRRGYDFPNSFLYDLPAVLLLSLLVALWDDARPFALPCVTLSTAWVASLMYGVYLFHLPVNSFFVRVQYHLHVPQLHWVAQIALLFIFSALVTEAVNRVFSWYWSKR